MAALALPATAGAITYAPVDSPGPPLSVPQAELDAALQCNGNLAAGRDPGPARPGHRQQPAT